MMNSVIASKSNDCFSANEEQVFLDQVNTEVKTYKKLSCIYSIGEEYSCLYRVKDGYVKIGVCDSFGNMVTWAILKKGDWLGNIRQDDKLSREFAIALTNAKLEQIRSSELQKLETGQLYQILLKAQDKRLELMEFHSRNIIFQSAEGRLMNFIKFLANRYGKTIDSVSYIRSFLTHEEMRLLLGISRQTITTHLGKFREKGLIDYDRYQLKVYWDKYSKYFQLAEPS